VRRTHTALPIFAWEYKTAHHEISLPFLWGALVLDAGKRGVRGGSGQ